MGKSKKRPRPKVPTDDGPNKKTKRVAEAAPSDLAVVKGEPNGAHTGEVDQSGDLSTKISEWLQEQTGEESMLLEQMLEESAAEEEDDGDEMEEILDSLEVHIRDKLKGLTLEERSKCFKYECEWKKCTFMTGNERKYFRHVDKHAEAMEEPSCDRYECEWDLCDFCARSYADLIGHVHFHAYHTKAKVYGASLSMLMKFPTCNFDSHTRNSIGHLATGYTCEWDNCGEKFDKALIFYHHVGCHIADLYPPGKKSLPEPVQCRWSNCKYRLNVSKWALRHSQRHTKQDLIACINCGEMLYDQQRYRDHCNRQLDVAYRRHQCEECDKYFATKRLLNEHLKKHISKLRCTLCPRKFSSESARSMHIRRVHLKHRPLACAQCEYRTYTKLELDSHVLHNHTARKLYRCDEFGCNAAFKTIEWLKKHITKHYNIPPPCYSCHICKIEYNVGWLLSKHLSFVHDVQRDPGMVRYRFKVDADGKYRLSKYVDRQRKSQLGKLPADANDCDTEDDATEQADGENASAALSKEDAAPVVKTKINNISMIGRNEVAIDLGLDFGEDNTSDGAAADYSSPKPPAPDSVRIKKNKSNSPESNEREPARLVEKKQEKKTKKPKKVQEFTVMQRYLKTGKMTGDSTQNS